MLWRCLSMVQGVLSPGWTIFFIRFICYQNSTNQSKVLERKQNLELQSVRVNFYPKEKIN